LSTYGRFGACDATSATKILAYRRARGGGSSSQSLKLVSSYSNLEIQKQSKPSTFLGKKGRDSFENEPDVEIAGNELG